MDPITFFRVRKLLMDYSTMPEGYRTSLLSYYEWEEMIDVLDEYGNPLKIVRYSSTELNSNPLMRKLYAYFEKKSDDAGFSGAYPAGLIEGHLYVHTPLSEDASATTETELPEKEMWVLLAPFRKVRDLASEYAQRGDDFTFASNAQLGGNAVLFLHP